MVFTRRKSLPRCLRLALDLVNQSEPPEFRGIPLQVYFSNKRYATHNGREVCGLYMPKYPGKRYKAPCAIVFRQDDPVDRALTLAHEFIHHLQYLYGMNITSQEAEQNAMECGGKLTGIACASLAEGRGVPGGVRCRGTNVSR